MNQKNLMSHVNPTATKELPALELTQLSEEDLQQIIGGGVSIELGIDPAEWWREISLLDNGQLNQVPIGRELLVTGAPSTTVNNLYSVNLTYSNEA